MAGALGVVITTDVPVEGRAAQPVYVDDSLPIVGPSRAIVVTTGEIPQAGGPAIPVRLAPAGTPAIGPALPVYVVSGSLSSGPDVLAYTNKVKAVAAANLIAYWPLAEASGSTATNEEGTAARNGTYPGGANTPTLGQTGIGDGRTAPTFDGGDYVSIHTASLAAAFNGQEGTLAAWFKVSAAGDWTDATERGIVKLIVDGSNLIHLRKQTTNNQILWLYSAGGTTKLITLTTSPTTWQHMAITWSKSADQMKAYIRC